MHPFRILPVLLALVGLAMIGVGYQSERSSVSAEDETVYMVTGFTYGKFTSGPPVCQGLNTAATYFVKTVDCGYISFDVTGLEAATHPDAAINVRYLRPNGTQFAIFQAAARTGTSAGTGGVTQTVTWSAPINPVATWPSGEVTVEVSVPGESGIAGRSSFFVQHLNSTLAVQPKPAGKYAPGDDVSVSGTISQVTSANGTTQTIRGVPAQFFLQTTTASGEVRGPYGPFTAGTNGAFTATLPGSATEGVTANADSNYQTTVAIKVVDTTYSDLPSGQWVGKSGGSAPITFTLPPDGLVLENSFVSAVGWVKPGDTYPFRVFVRNYQATPFDGAAVSIPPVDGTTFTRVAPATGSGTAVINADGSISWNIGTVPVAADAGPAIATLVVEARADTLGQDPQLAWKNLSTTATLTYTDASAPVTAPSHGPKVIPPDENFDTARYGDRPFPVVAVDYFDRKHTANHSSAQLEQVINSPDILGSTFNLYQEMSFGQLFPHATVPSAGIATADWSVDWNSERYQQDGWSFTEPAPQGVCKGPTLTPAVDTPIMPARINDGWYQLPGTTEYYGGDRYTFGGAYAGARTGVGALFQIDDACGPTGKAVYDAAHAADPEIDYSEYDTDKDGVVDFFMMVFAGVGGNGESQLNTVPPYDNIWPHSSTLEVYFTDPETGQPGYVSDDQLKDLEGNALYFVDSTRTAMTTQVTEFPVYVRVGPYNVNPEKAIEKASVISHEYGHSLGLPDFYSLGSRATYGDWNLMATDKSQHMDVFSKQELGWIVPRALPEGETTISGWQDSKANTHRIDWVTPDGTPYTLEGPGVANGEAYVAKLPARRVVDEAKVQAGASAPHVWWSGSGNDFGCPPLKGHNFDIVLPELQDIDPGTPVTVTFNSMWDIEWDYDYGFVMASTDNGQSYVSLASDNGYTTPRAINPTANSCQATFGEGLTGTSGSYAAGTQHVDRVLSEYPDPLFLPDQYDLSFAAGLPTVLRFSYSTDPGLARPGWFIDDVTVMAGDQVIYDSDFETDPDDDGHIFNGGCRGGLRSGTICTAPWRYVNAAQASTFDHAYYLEMRDRSGFDYDSHGQNDRAALAFLPGMLLVYTDEAHGYGNVGTDDPPAQSPLDSQPQPNNRTPNLNDAAYTAAANDGTYTDFSPNGHTDNYTGNSANTIPWVLTFDCLSFEVLAMSGDGIGPATSPGDLTGDVTFNLGEGCAPMDYGYGTLENSAPTAIAQARPLDPHAGDEVTFDGSASFDDITPTNALTYDWDFDGDGTFDGSGQTATHAYPEAGAYTATLRVTDGGGLASTDTVDVNVSPAVTATPVPTPSPTPEPDKLPAKVTGAGRIAVSGGEADFNINVNFAGGEAIPEGSIRYRDRGNAEVQSTSVDSVVSDGTHAVITGIATVNGVPGKPFRIEVTDVDKHNDIFSIDLPANDYSAGGTLTKGDTKVRQ